MTSAKAYHHAASSTHRITTLAQADFILVLEDGRVAQIRARTQQLCSRRRPVSSASTSIQNVLEDELNQANPADDTSAR